MLTDHDKQATGNREPADETNKEDPTQGIPVWLQPLTVNLQDLEKSAMANRQWTQQRLHRAGLSDSNLCQLCAGCEHGDQVGTHLHRFFCPVTQHEVRNLAPSWIRDMLDNFNGSLSPIEHCALVRGMIAPPVVPTRPDSDFGTIVWHAPLV